MLRCICFGICRYGAIQDELGIASNVLADRLARMAAEGILDRVLYQTRPARHEYQLTDKGAALVPVILALRTWGTEFGDLRAPLGPLRHADCGGAVAVTITCDTCGEPVSPLEVRGGPATVTA